MDEERNTNPRSSGGPSFLDTMEKHLTEESQDPGRSVREGSGSFFDRIGEILWPYGMESPTAEVSVRDMASVLREAFAENRNRLQLDRMMHRRNMNISLVVEATDTLPREFVFNPAVAEVHVTFLAETIVLNWQFDSRSRSWVQQRPRSSNVRLTLSG